MLDTQVDADATREFLVRLRYVEIFKQINFILNSNIFKRLQTYFFFVNTKLITIFKFIKENFKLRE